MPDKDMANFGRNYSLELIFSLSDTLDMWHKIREKRLLDAAPTHWLWNTKKHPKRTAAGVCFCTPEQAETRSDREKLWNDW